MKHKYYFFPNSGQAMVTLLFFIIAAVTVTSAAVVVVLENSLATSGWQQGRIAFSAAEAGVENALLRLLRDLNYTGETLTIGESIVEVTITGGDPKIITTSAKVGNFLRKMQVQAEYNNNILTISSWKEIF